MRAYCIYRLLFEGQEVVQCHAGGKSDDPLSLAVTEAVRSWRERPPLCTSPGIPGLSRVATVP